MAGKVLRRLVGNQRGVTLVEFAFVAPILIVMIMGLSDLLYTFYATSILTGAVQKAGRDSAIQGGGEAADDIDATVVSALARMMKTPSQSCDENPTAGTWCATRRNYTAFAQVRPEPFVDNNRNAVRDPKECFTDINGNGTWNPDAGRVGQGGSDDVTLYTFRLTFARIFPLPWRAGGGTATTISVSTLLKNQPYAAQNIVVPAEVCT